jgi:predicted RNase H-like HicB family nuclease
MNPMDEIVLLVVGDDRGVYSASWDDPRGGGISTQGNDLAELQAMVRDAVLCHFDEDEVPARVRLHFAQDPALVVA